MRLMALAVFFILLQSCATSEKQINDQVKLDKKSEAYLAFADYGKVKLSKNGTYLAVTSIFKNQSIVSILDAKTRKSITMIPTEKNMKVNRFLWASDTRLLIHAIVSEGYLKGVRSEGYLFAMDFDGKNKRQIYPKKNKAGVTSVNWSVKSFSIIDDELIDNRYVLIAENTFMVSSAYYDLKLLDIKNGRLKRYDRVKMATGDYALDNDKRARLAYKVDKKYKTTFYSKNLKTNEWTENPFFTNKSRNIIFLGFSKDNSTFYFLGDNKQSLRSLYSAQISLLGKVSKVREIFSYEDGDVLSAKWDHKAHKVLFVEYGEGKPKRKYFSQSPRAQLLKQLEKAFPGEKVYLAKPTGDMSLLVAYSDKRPKTYYIYNHKNKSVNEFLSSNEATRPYPKVASRAFEYQARDGLRIKGYFYKAKTNKVSPLVMYVHGGPFGIYDRWGYDGDIQYMVSRGYSVMQVNYRGSGSRGLNFEKMGYKKLGTAMQEDLADAAKWAIKNKMAQKGKICLWGISYGAYASLMSIHKYPDLFECAVGFGGVYDWREILSEGDSAGNKWAQNYWGPKLPESDEERFAQSPVSLTKDLKKEVYVMHGVEDVRCAVAQARRMKAALKKHGKKFKYKEYPEIGHWFVTEQSQKNHAYNEIVNFFDSKIK